MAERARTILHVDMDAFFVAVEVRRRPELRGRPVIVGGAGERGVVAACSYEARRFGIHSAMPSVRARRLCPDALFLRGDYGAYAEASREVHAVFSSITPLVEGIALDEAFLDVTGAARRLGSGVEIAHLVRRRVAEETALTCSVGVASTKFLAKLASEAAKPRADAKGVRPGAGVVEVPLDGELAFLHRHPVQALWGVGPATLDRLNRLGVRTVGELAALPETTLVATLGNANGRHLHALASGIDERPVEPDRATKSVGHEQTFAHDLHDHDALGLELVRLADGVAARLREHRLAGRTVTVKIRFGSFATITRATTVATAIDTAAEIVAAARPLLSAVDPAPGVRLLGVSVSQLTSDAARQLHFDLEGTSGPDWHETSRAIDDIRARFGETAIGPASLSTGDGLKIVRRGDRPWGPDDHPDDHSDGPERSP
jgi:DNA polymerase-4